MTTECLECGSTVTRQFARVFGDRDDDVHRCPDCASYSELTDGAAAGRKLQDVI